MIILKNIYKQYSNSLKQNILNNISLHIKKGDIFGLIGFSGAGKSTLLRTINFLEKPTKGEVIIDGVNLNTLDKKSLSEARKSIGMIFQHFNLITRKNIEKNIGISLEINKVNKEIKKQRIEEIIELVGLKNLLKKYPNNISGGQKQRVGIARALMNKPKILLCDEATSALDPVTTISILNLLKEINKKIGLTIVVITHEIEVVRAICNKIAVLHKGRIVETGSTDVVFNNPKSKITKLLINHSIQKVFTFSSFFEGTLEKYKFLSTLPFITIKKSNITNNYINNIEASLIFNITLPINNIKSVTSMLRNLGLYNLKQHI